MGLLVYFSTKSGNTHRFVERLGLRAQRIPISPTDALVVDEDFILITPTYGGGYPQGAVPAAVGRFLNNAVNRTRMRGVIACGNTNFGAGFCLAGKIIAQRCNVPHLFNIELFGTQEDVERIRTGVEQFWTPPSPPLVK